MPSINFSRALCETSDLIKCAVCKENIDSMQENINGMHVHILLLNVFWTLILKNVTSISCVSVDVCFNDKVGLNDTSSSLTLPSRLQLNFLSEVSTKPQTAATECCCWLLRSRGKLYTACRASASPFLKHFSHHAYNSRLSRSTRYNSSVDDPVFLDGNGQSFAVEGYGRGSRAAWSEKTGIE